MAELSPARLFIFDQQIGVQRYEINLLNPFAANINKKV
jgi:hypothetical protein